MSSKRTRRSPEESRRLILEATRRLLGERGPNAIGLKDVAAEAGVSHALVSHYFGTRDRLIETALAEHLQNQRDAMLERIADSLDEGPGAWLESYFKTTTNPLNARLAVWGLLSGRLESEDFFTNVNQGGRVTVDFLERELAARGYEVSRDDIEFALAVLVVVPYGWAVGRKAVLGSMGLDAGEERDDWFFDRFRRLMERLIAEPDPPNPRSS